MTSQNSKSPESIAKQLAEKLWEDLSDRRGFNTLMSNIKYDDSEIYEEIISLWSNKIKDEIKNIKRVGND